jgi:hypothetical protein
MTFEEKLQRLLEHARGVEFYVLIYLDEDDEPAVFFVAAESHFDAQRIAEKDVKQWEGYRVYSVNHVRKEKILSGEPCNLY